MPLTLITGVVEMVGYATAFWRFVLSRDFRRETRRRWSELGGWAYALVPPEIVVATIFGVVFAPVAWLILVVVRLRARADAPDAPQEEARVERS